jgi:branched-chain amino acid transport system ATP-binding protein
VITTTEPQTQAVLRLRDVHAAYGAVRALHGVSLDVRPGTVVALLGANGAGKSTTLRVISGMLAATAGTVEYDGATVARQSPSALARRGLVHVPEGRQIFGEFTVEENLRLGGSTRPASEVKRTLVEVYDDFPILYERRKQRAATLSGGEQQMLAMGRALVGKPRLLLLDEPSLGLAPLVVREIYEIIRMLSAERGATILLVEQSASLALDVAHYAYVLETGRIAVSGTAAELRDNEDVRRSYLGY